MGEAILGVSREFFREIVLPVLEREHPGVAAQTAFGLFGYGSEALQLDDAFSKDHHWGIRIDALMPDDLLASQRDAVLRTVAASLPASYRGHALRQGHLEGAGLAPDGLRGFLERSIGIDHPPRDHAEWLALPEEDIIHVINGEVWHDPSGTFSEIRRTLKGYYPEPVRRRRLAHWCRYFSGMGTYALKRALLRDNEYFAAVAFGKAVRWGVQIAFMLERIYYPYDKWIMDFFKRLPRLHAPLAPIVDEACRLSTSWERKLELLDQMSEVLDETMVKDGIIRPHTKFQKSPTSGYRLLEHAYAELIQNSPDEIKQTVPQWEQVFMERFHSGNVARLSMDTWDHLLCLTEDRQQH